MIRDGLKSLGKELKNKLQEQLLKPRGPTTKQPSHSELARPPESDGALKEQGEEPPVVARMMIEIRSDGSRTIARGAIQDEISGEKVSIEAEGSSPLQLAARLAKSLITSPLAGAQLARSLRAQQKTVHSQTDAPPANVHKQQKRTEE